MQTTLTQFVSFASIDPPVTLVNGGADDVEAVKALFETILAQTRPSGWEEILAASRDQGWVAYDLDLVMQTENGLFQLVRNDKGDNVGFIVAHPLPHEFFGPEPVWRVQKLYLMPDYHGKGLGSKLLQYMLDVGREYGYRQVYIETIPVFEAAIRLYEKFGLQRIAPTPMNHPMCIELLGPL